MTELTRNAVAEALHKAVAEKGEDYVYPVENGCRYSSTGDDGKFYPACIVGHVVAALAPDVFESWAEYEEACMEYGGYGGSFTVREGLAEEEYVYGIRKAINVDEATEFALSAAQGFQDAGHSWKDAQEAFDRVLAGEDEFSVRRDIRERAE